MISPTRYKWETVTTAHGQTTQLELGIWRESEKTGHPMVAHAGLLGKPLTEKVTGLNLMVPAGSPARVIGGEYGNYLVVSCQSDVPFKAEIRAVLKMLLLSLR